MTHAADFWDARYAAEAYAYGTEPNAYFRRQLRLTPGGPCTAELLYEPAQLAADFTGLTLLENCEATVVLHEGSFHAGPAQVVRLLARCPGHATPSTELTYSI